MISGVHAIIYATDAGKARRFVREVLGLRCVDAGKGWLIFALPPAELAFHPGEEAGAPALYLMCDDIEKTMAGLIRKGVEFTSPVVDRGWGLLTTLRIPGAGEVSLYQPKHPTAIRKTRRRAAAGRKPVRGRSRR